MGYSRIYGSLYFITRREDICLKVCKIQYIDLIDHTSSDAATDTATRKWD